LKKSGKERELVSRVAADKVEMAATEDPVAMAAGSKFRNKIIK